MLYFLAYFKNLKKLLYSGNIGIWDLSEEQSKEEGQDHEYILTDFNYATLTSPYIFQKTVECKLPLLR